MSVAFVKGEKVIVRAIKSQNNLSTRDYSLEKYEGQTGKIDNSYSMIMGGGKTVTLYMVRMMSDRRVIALYEDEIRQA